MFKRYHFGLSFLCALFWASPVLLADAWRPISPEELALKAPKVEKNADAEALFWDVRVADDLQNSQYLHTTLMHYLRIKIFTERGKDKYGTVEIPYSRKTNISEISGRTTKPDGNQIELSKDSVFEKTVVRGGGLKVREKSFAMPGVEPGAIIEYQWKESRDDQVANYLRLLLQMEMPVEQVTYHIKPLSVWWLPFRMRMLSFNCPGAKFQPESNGYYALSASNIPAFHKEPEMPPDAEVSPWALIYYEEDKNLSEDKFWDSLGKELYRDYKTEIKVNDEVKRIAESAVEGAKTSDEKLARLAGYCRKNIKNVFGEEISTEEREKAKVNNTTVDTLRRGQGTSLQINLAFAALALAEGFDARIARLPDRGDMFFDKRRITRYFLGTYDVAVNVDGKWRFYDVADPNLPIGMLRWQEEGVPALITDPKEPTFVQTPVTTAETSQTARIGEFTLDAEGTLEGNVRELLSGHAALTWRSSFASASAAEREEGLRKEIKARFTDAELSDVNFTVPADVSKGAGLRYHIKIANYAQRTGKRLFLVPSYFESGEAARFPESKREFPVYFHYPWSEYDSVTIKPPASYELDHADAPNSFKFPPVGEYGVKIGVAKDGTLVYTRELKFGSNGSILFDPKDYPALKKVFDRIHEADNHVLTFKAQPAAPSPATE